MTQTSTIDAAAREAILSRRATSRARSPCNHQHATLSEVGTHACHNASLGAKPGRVTDTDRGAGTRADHEGSRSALGLHRTIRLEKCGQGARISGLKVELTGAAEFADQTLAAEEQPFESTELSNAIGQAG